MLKKYDILIPVVSIFILLLAVRFLFHNFYDDEFKPNAQVEVYHTFLTAPKTSEFQQYFYKKNALITLPRYPEFKYGQKVYIKGVVEEQISNKNNALTKRLIIRNPEVKLVEDKPLAVLSFIRQKVISAYKSSLPPRESALIAGIVIGADDGISKNFSEELKRTGMLHVVVASGSNVVLIAGIIFGLINRHVKKREAVIFTIFAIFLYALLAGFDPPIVRASIMASFAFVGSLLGRQKTALISLFFASWLMLFLSPTLITDIGFQLSFSATFGIIMFQKVLLGLASLLPRFIKEDFVTTLSAQIGALPFLLVAFGEINLFSIFINTLLLWTVPIIMIFGLTAGALSLISPVLSAPFLFLAYPFLFLFSEVVRYSSNLYIPLSLTSVAMPIAVIYYFLLVIFLTRKKSKK